MFKAQDLCCGCSACVAICPKDCLSLKRDSNGFYVPRFNSENCIDCDLCVKVCPLNKSVCTNTQETKAYGAVAKDEDICFSSSSGGLFSVLSNKILDKNGVVYGAAFDESFSVYHKSAFSAVEATNFRGSKYVQSNIGSCFRQIKKLLDDNRWVYFSGTPCQVAGLASYLKKDYDKLITQDFICHSVPSPLVWDHYKSFREEEFHGKIVNISFRAKEHGNKGYKLKLAFDNGATYACDGNDLYTKAFIEGLSSNESCYSCKFKGNNRQSDITLGDFWGVEDHCSHLADRNGVSLVLLHSNKGMSLFEEINDDITCVEVDVNKAFAKNPMALKSINFNPRRKKFFRFIKKKGFNKAYTKATSPSFKQKVKSIIKNRFI